MTIEINIIPLTDALAIACISRSVWLSVLYGPATESVYSSIRSDVVTTIYKYDWKNVSATNCIQPLNIKEFS